MERRNFLAVTALAAAAIPKAAAADGLRVLYVNRRYWFTINPENIAGDPAEVLNAQWSISPTIAEVDASCGFTESAMHCYGAYVTGFRTGPATLTCRAVTRSGKPLSASIGVMFEQSSDPEAATLNLTMG